MCKEKSSKPYPEAYHALRLREIAFITTTQSSPSESGSQGRIGQLTRCFPQRGQHKPGRDIQTPLLFPVVCLMTGTTARGGGIWKYILQANTKHGLLRRSPSIPLMSQVVHFMDFKVSPKAVEVWRREGLMSRYVKEFSSLAGDNPLFLDSGGFKLLFNQKLELSAYGLPMDEQQAERIVKLQLDLGGDFIATLDYPLPPGLVRSEAIERMKKSQANALKAAQYLKANPQKAPFLFIAAHGQDRQDIESYVSDTFQQMEQNGLNGPFGIAIGSLVPLRGSRKYPLIVELVRGAISGIPEKYRHQTPIHVFGVTGNLIPLLVYLGVDTFDSSTYIQQARSLKYFDPTSHQGRAVLELSDLDLTCDCAICRELDFDELHTSLTSNIRYSPLPSGHYKSKYYADIALHNLEMDFRIVEGVREALLNNEMAAYLARHASLFPKLDTAFDLLAAQDEELARLLSRTTFINPSLPSLSLEEFRTISLNYTSDSFSVNHNGYQPPSSTRILLVIPCSSEKPYSNSRTHRLLKDRLSERFLERASAIHKVTLSGLYGPVPQEYENEEAVVQYDFQLDSSNAAQILLVAGRMVEYIKRHEAHYEAIFGYATSNAYRSVLEQVEKEHESFNLFPTNPKSRRLTEFYRHKNIAELLDAIDSVISNDTRQLEFPKRSDYHDGLPLEFASHATSALFEPTFGTLCREPPPRRA